MLNARSLTGNVLAPLMLLATFVAEPASARADTDVPVELAGVDITEKPGAVLPRELRFRDHDGADVELGQYLDGERPALLVLAYYDCPMLCTLVLNGVVDGMKSLRWNAGEEFRLVVVSIDPRDTPESAAKKRQAYLASYGRPVGARGFDFLVGDETTVKKLADTVGFAYRWDETQEQYAHAAGAFVLTPDAKLSRTLYGISFPEKNLNLSLVEASQGKFGSAWDKVVLFCFHYDPNARGYVLASTRIMKAGGGLTLLLMAAWIVRFWQKERLRTVSPTREAA